LTDLSRDNTLRQLAEHYREDPNMGRLITTTNGRRRGIVAVLVAVLLTTLLGVAAIAVDGGLMQDNRRCVQAATDAAAMAAAQQLYANYPAIVASNYTTADPGNNAATAAQASATANGYKSDGVNASVVVNIPPKSGPFSGRIGYAEVLITYYQPRHFSAIWGSTTLPVSARAVARGSWAGSGDGIICLDPTAQNSLNAAGNGSLTVTGGANVIVDSNDPASAARATGGGAVTAANFLITGGANGTFNGNVVTGVLPTPDPLAYLPVPPVPPDGTMSSKGIGQGNKQYTLTPGRYTNLPNFNQGDVVILQQASAGNGGIYYIDGGGFASTGANIIMDSGTTGGVMIYNNPANSSGSQGISISGNASGTINLSALTSGPYAGMLFWQNRSAAQTMKLDGNGSFTLSGTFYAANAQLSVTGNGTAVIGSQYISRTVYFGGGGATTINYTDKGTARVRIIQLVE
jgi:hypothetical protein